MIYIADSHSGARRTLSQLLAGAGLEARACDAAHALLAACAQTIPCCVLTEFRLPDLGAVDLMERLQDAEVLAPVIVVTSHDDADSAVRSLRAGAFDYFTKPVDEQALLDRVQRALREDRCQRQRRSAQAQLRHRLDSLSVRERQVLDGLLQGQASKQIARGTGLSQKTVENCRARVAAKMQAGSIAELVRLALAAGAGALDHQDLFHNRDARLGPQCAYLCPHRLLHHRHPASPRRLA